MHLLRMLDLLCLNSDPIGVSCPLQVHAPQSDYCLHNVQQQVLQLFLKGTCCRSGRKRSRDSEEEGENSEPDEQTTPVDFHGIVNSAVQPCFQYVHCTT